MRLWVIADQIRAKLLYDDYCCSEQTAIYYPFFLQVDTFTLPVHFQNSVEKCIVDIQAFEQVQNVNILQPLLMQISNTNAFCLQTVKHNLKQMTGQNNA
jgi:hypothetical protein